MQNDDKQTIENLEKQLVDLKSRSQERNQSQGPSKNEPLVTWTASEYIAHHKSASWYAGFAFALALLAVAIYFLTGDIISIVAVVVGGISLAVFASRKPEVREYAITPNGVHISGRLQDFETLKSFAIHDEDTISSIYLLPIKRFAPGFRIYYPPEQEDKIIETLAEYLPMEDSDPDVVDSFMRKIRF